MNDFRNFDCRRRRFPPQGGPPLLAAWMVAVTVAGCVETPTTPPTPNANQPAEAAGTDTGAGEPSETPPGRVESLGRKLDLPNAELIDQDGHRVHLRDDLAQGRIVVLNFVFTRCKGVCPPMGANFARLHRLLEKRGANYVQMISITADPVVDTPARLKAWSDKFGGGRRWSLLTGEKHQVDAVLKQLEVFTADKNDHSPFILFGDPQSGKWQRVHGLTAPDKLCDLICGLPKPQPTRSAGAATSTDGPQSPTAATSATPAALRYFTDVELTDQHGEKLRFYSDLMAGKTVVINSFFCSCKGACPKLQNTFVQLQQHLGDRLDRDVHLISLTVDPVNDTPDKLKAYADALGAKPGWHFLTGPPTNVETALRKLGQYAATPDQHSNLFLVGNLRTGLWKKVKGLSTAAEIAAVVDGVVEDPGPDSSEP